MGLVVAMCLQQGTVKPQALAEEVETAVAVALPEGQMFSLALRAVAVAKVVVVAVALPPPKMVPHLDLVEASAPVLVLALLPQIPFLGAVAVVVALAVHLLPATLVSSALLKLLALVPAWVVVLATDFPIRLATGAVVVVAGEEVVVSAPRALALA
jgi:hypothetical protein